MANCKISNNDGPGLHCSYFAKEIMMAVVVIDNMGRSILLSAIQIMVNLTQVASANNETLDKHWINIG